MSEESQNFRRALISTILSKKSDKVQQRVQNKIDSSIHDWEVILFDYINVTTKLNNMVHVAEQQQQVHKLRSLLKQCTDLIKSSSQQFTSICELIELVLPMSNLNTSWMDSIVKQESRLGQMKDALSHVLLFSSNRDVIEVVQKMMLQITDVQQKINYATTKVQDAVHITLKSSSSILNNESRLIRDYDDDSATSKTSNNSYFMEEWNGGMGVSQFCRIAFDQKCDLNFAIFFYPSY